MSSVLIEPPMTFEPRPSTVTVAAFFLRSVNRVSFALRQAWPSATRWPASSPSIPWGNVAATAYASARSMLSPPKRMCSPTASRERARSPPSSVTAISVKSVVAAADVADEDDVFDLDLRCPFLVVHGQPGVKGGLRFLEKRDVFEPGLAGGFHG